MTSIKLEHLSKLFGRGASAVTAIDNVSVDIEAGEFFFLLGPSGCGKTTLLRMIAGLIEPSAGRVWFDDRDVTALPTEDRQTAMVFQNYALWPHMTVSQNVEFGPRARGRTRAEARQTAVASLQRVQMADFARRRPNQLSGGQQQRVALARALAAEPNCLLLDEPLSNLDAQLRLQMRDDLRQLVKATGTTGVYVTHDQKEALSMADRIAVMHEGRIAQVGRPQEIYNRPATRFVADFLGEANFITGRIVRTGRPATIETLAGTLLADEADGGTSAVVTCCVRPERTAIAPADADAPPTAAGTLTATVTTTTYLGEIRQYTCQVAETQWKVSVLAGRGQALEAGTDVTLTVAAEDVTVLPT